MKRKLVFWTGAAALAISLQGNAQAQSIMPDFSTVPTGWVTDRYQPNSFSNVGSYQGRADVLGIGISSAQDLSNRPAGYQSTFYNTQGMQYALTGGAGSVLSADLYVPTSWASATNGSVRTDMWGVMTNGSSVSDYPIVGFTNVGGVGTFQAWDADTANGWVTLSTAVDYNAWNSLAIGFTGTSYVYSVDGNVVYTDTTINGSTGLSAAIMQAYNFGGTSGYTAYWANTTPVPEPETYAMMLVGLALLGFMARRRKQKDAAAA